MITVEASVRRDVQPRGDPTGPRRLRRGRTRRGAWLGLALLALPGGALAQPDQPMPEPEVPEPPPEPPRLVSPVDVPYPVAALDAGFLEPVEVVLELLVDAEGRVAQVDVVSGPTEHGFREAAAAGARRMRFEPATREGEPIAARIRYRHGFVPPPPPPPPPTTGAVRVRAIRGGQVVGDAAIELRGAGDAVLASGTGELTAGELAPGIYRVRVLPVGGFDVTSEVRVTAGHVAEHTVPLPDLYEVPVDDRWDPEEPLEFGATAEVRRPREATTRSVSIDEALTLAGTRGDPIRAVELMPGVARVIGEEPVVRGSSPENSLVLFEGTPIPLLYHFGALKSFMHDRFLSGISLYPGNFSPRYGRATGAVFEVEARDPGTRRAGGALDVNLLDASLFAETPIGERAGIGVAARRSYVDAWLVPIVRRIDGVGIRSAPRYWDYQLFGFFRPEAHARLRWRVYGSSDLFKLSIDEADEDVRLRGNFGIRFAFHDAAVDWERRTDDFREELMTSIGRNIFVLRFGSFLDLEVHQTVVSSRAEWRLELFPRLSVIAGADLQSYHTELAYEGPRIGVGNEDTSEDRDELAAEVLRVLGDGWTHQPAGYVELDLTPHDGLQLLVGGRIDYDSRIEDWSADPRGTVLVTPIPELTLKAAFGLFSQAPDYFQTHETVGNPDLDFERAWHLTVGGSVRPTAGLEVELDLFYKRLLDRVVDTREGDAPFLVNDGTGRVYGAELAGRLTHGPVSATLAYTLSRSERRDRGEPARVFEYDQTHILNIAGRWQIDRRWVVSGAFRVVTGNPETPLEGASFDLDRGGYQPIEGAPFSDRAPYFHRLDLRVERQWRWTRHRRLSLYLEIRNVYNAKNPEGTQYSFDYRESETVNGIPILPSLGIRGEL